MSALLVSRRAALAAAIPLFALLNTVVVTARPPRPEHPFADFQPSRVQRPDPGRGRPVARVFDRYLYADSLAGPNADMEARAEALRGAVFAALGERYVAEQGLSAAPGEVEEFLRVMREKSPDTIPSDDETRQMAAGFVRQWKLDSSLYARYGGKVIFQQLNPREPVGAYRAFLEAMQKRKVFEIYDRALEPWFWSYLRAEHWFEVPPGEVNFRIPWWLQAPAGAGKAGSGPAGGTGPPTASGAQIPAAGYALVGSAVRFVFDPSPCEWATNGVTGEWTSLKSLKVVTAHLAGDFNAWSTSSWLMRPVGPTGSLFVLERPFAELGGSGRHEFKFVVNGVWWVEPPAGAPNRAETNLGNRSANLVLVIP